MSEKLENIGLGGCQKLKYEVNNQKIPETPTRLFVHTFSTLTYFFPKSPSFPPPTPPPKKKQPECSLNKRLSRTLYTNKPRQPSWLGFLDLETFSFDIQPTSVKYQSRV